MVIRVDQMPMERHHDSQRSGRLAMTFGDLRVVDRVVASIASSPRLGSDGTVMTRYDDSQRSGRLAVTFGDLRDVDRMAASIASLPRLGFDGSMMKRHDDSQRSKPQEVEGLRLALTSTPALLSRERPELDQARLVRVQLQGELADPLGQLRPEPLGIRGVVESDDDVIRVAHDDHLATRLRLPPAPDPQVEHAHRSNT